MGSLCGDVGIVSGSVWDHFDVIVVALRGVFRIILGRVWAHDEVDLGSVWNHFGIAFGISLASAYHFWIAL